MKTITEVARSLGVSRQTLYNAIDKADNVDIETLTKGRRGKARLFDEESERIVKELLSKHCQSNVNEKQIDNGGIDNGSGEKQEKNAEKQIEDLRRKLAEAEKKISDQAEDLDKLRREADALREGNKILIRTNATNAITIQKLQEREQMKLAGGGEDRRAGWIRRTIQRITGKGKDQKE